MAAVSPPASRLPRELPLVGRGEDLAGLQPVFSTAETVEPVTLLTGESGVGKSRLAGTLAGEARRREWTVVYGRAYPVETGVPYALLSDAFLPLLRDMDDSTLTVLTRGTEADLQQLFPALGVSDEPVRTEGVDARELRTRLYWNFTEFVKRLAERGSVLVVLEDLHWADPSSLALLHFVGRHVGGSVRILGTYNTDYRDANERLIRLERSLLSLRRLRLHPLHPLTRESTLELLEEVFQVSGPPIREFNDLLYGWTRGNPYFIEQTLDALVEGGRLYQRDGTWLGWEARELELPTSIRDAVLTRVRGLADSAVSVAEIMAVTGGRTRLPLLDRVTALTPHQLTAAVEDLLRMGLVEERTEGGAILLDFRHPLTREALYQRLSLTRSRMLHRAVAEGLEQVYGTAAADHADELAYHFAIAGGDDDEPRAVRYLATAGRRALRRHADREAAAYLDAAVTRLGGGRVEPAAEPSPEPEAPDLSKLRAELARARARLGQYEEAREIWTHLLEEARTTKSRGGTARAHRHLGLLAYWRGRHGAALEHYEAALRAVGEDGPAPIRARLHLAAGVALQELGRADEARRRVERALAIAEEIGEAGLLGRVHRALALLFTWIGETDLAREHGWRAVELGQRAGDGHVVFWGRWAVACLEGLTGGPVAMAPLMEETRVAAEELRSPVLGLWVTELAVELGYHAGDWDGALAQGERGISLASDLNQRTLLVRLLVWTATVYLGRGDLERAGELVERAWTLADPDRQAGGRPLDLHAVVPAYIGRTALLLARGSYEEAVATGEKGVEIADRSGYVIWALFQLLPLVGEAYIRLVDLEGAARVGERLRRECQPMGHTLGLVWADTADALIAWHSGQVERAATLLRAAAESIEAIGIVPHAARLRRQLAGRLADLGDREGALAELRKVHEVFGRLGAQPELDKTREMFREMGSRPPSRSEAEGTADLTGREAEIASLVANRKSNKAIARELGISPRTVTTHLSNIYRKLEIGSRGELVDLVREARVPVEPRRAPPD